VAGDAADHPPAGRWSGHHRRMISRSRPQRRDDRGRARFRLRPTRGMVATRAAPPDYASPPPLWGQRAACPPALAAALRGCSGTAGAARAEALSEQAASTARELGMLRGWRRYSRTASDRKMFAVCGCSSPFVGVAGASGPDLGPAPCRLHPDPNMSVDRAVRATSEVGFWHRSRGAAALASP
jgi:hypothetical protein